LGRCGHEGWKGFRLRFSVSPGCDGVH
jgi:hypothetical protein